MAVNDPEIIVRIAAKGDGVTASGRHVGNAAPGDMVLADGTLQPGPHHVDPPCRHFARCGGCQLQQCDEQSLTDFVTNRVVFAAQGQAIIAENVLPTHLSPPQSRRRATVHAINGGGRPAIGFRESGSHRLVDVKECHVLAPELFALIEPLRGLLSHWHGKYAVDIDLVIADQGVAIDLKNLTFEGLEQTQALLDVAQSANLARLTVDQGYGTEAIWEPEPVTVTLAGTPVGLPPGAFLQATRDGEAVLMTAVQEWSRGSTNAADLFSGLGTFAFAMSDHAKVSAFEASRDASLSCRLASRRHQKPVEPHHRDLFRNPLRPDELAVFDTIVLDPPRAGAREQIQRIAASSVARVIYVSCNPQSWAKDAATLVGAGFTLRKLRPVGQFRWSTHVELVSLFERGD